MQFTAYLTRSEVEAFAPQFDAPIARIAQIFAAEVMPIHSTNYIVRCIASRVDADIATHTMRPDVSPPVLIAAPETQSAQYTFNGYHPGHLEGFLLQSAAYCVNRKPTRPKHSVATRAPSAKPSGYQSSPGVFPPAHPTPTPSRADSASPTRTLSSRAASSSPTRRAARQQAPPTPKMLERGMRAVHAKANVRQPEFPLKATVVQDWQAVVHDEQTPLKLVHATANLINVRLHDEPTALKPRGRVALPRRTSDRPLHLQGSLRSLGVSTRQSASSTSSFDWEQDGESVLPEHIIAAAEREGMC